MIDTDDLKKWWYSGRIEDFPEEEMRDRLNQVLSLPTGDILRTIPYLGDEEIVEYRSDEVIGLCPATGLIDLYTVKIRYIPDKSVPELKSLKFYLMQYKDIPINHEHLLHKIHKDIEQLIHPTKLYTQITVAVRGGITTSLEKGFPI